MAEVTALAGRVTIKRQDPEQGKRWAYEMVARGILTQGYVNVMLAHEGRGAEQIVDAAVESFKAVRTSEGTVA